MGMVKKLFIKYGGVECKYGETCETDSWDRNMKVKRMFFLFLNR